MPRLFVGLPALQGDIKKYQSRFDLVELHPFDMSLPRPATLRKWRELVPPGFAFSVVLPRVVGELVPGKALDEALDAALNVAKVIEARCVVLATPASVRPTAANKKRLAAVLDRIPPDGIVRCWEPMGIWEREDVVATARQLGIVPVLDAAREAVGSGPVAYSRLRALGKSAALSSATLEKIADRLRGRREVFVVVEGAREAARVKTVLAESLSNKRASRSASMIIRPKSPGQLIAEDEEQ